MLGMATRELNAGNMFKLGDSARGPPAQRHPQRPAGHPTKNGALQTDAGLAVHQDLKLEIKAGDDIVFNPSPDHQLVVIDPDNDEWLLLTEDKPS
jgi:hypothetical protein